MLHVQMLTTLTLALSPSCPFAWAPRAHLSPKRLHRARGGADQEQRGGRWGEENTIASMVTKSRVI